MSRSGIVIASDLEAALSKQKEQLKGSFFKVYEKDEFLIEDAREVANEAYLASEVTKHLILCAQRFNMYAQNALLKVVEEPPKNLVFIFIAPSKSSLLPTIRSRMPITTIKERKERKPFPFPISKIDAKSVYGFLKSANMGKSEAIEMVSSLFFELKNTNIKMDEEMLESFEAAPRMLMLNEKPSLVFAMLLLKIMEKKESEVKKSIRQR